MNTQCFELRWRSTIVTSQDDYGEVPYVRVTKVRDMSLDSIKRLTTKCFDQLRWRSTIVTSQDDYSQVPCVRVVTN